MTSTSDQSSPVQWPSFLAQVPTWFWLALILALGAGLRLYRLGANTFWIDEVGVANAARAATIPEMLRIAHNHVMAMPLDYIVDWLFARLGVSEFILRLPSAIWGVLALAAAYPFFQRLANRKAALIGTLLLALAPVHVQYSQELRFYSALVFFTLLSSWLLLRALQEPSPRRWIAWTLLTILGIFFHIYVVLVGFTGIVWLWISKSDRPPDEFRRQRQSFIRSSCVVLLAFIAALFTFGGVYTYDIPLLLGENSLLTVIGVGLGWVPFYTQGFDLAWLWGLICLGLALLGAFRVVWKRARGLQAGLLYSAILQILLITAFNALKHYFVTPRQYLFLLPVFLFFSALGLETVLARAGKWIAGRFHAGAAPGLAWLVCLALLLIVALPALAAYFAGDKGQTQAILQALQGSWQPADQVLVIPDYDVQQLEYYLQADGDPRAIASSIYGAAWDTLPQLENPNRSQYLVTLTNILPEQIDLIRAQSFRAIVVPDAPNRYSLTLWVRSATN